jgi:hypothetical protein
MDTRAFSMARSLRSLASVGALVFFSVSGTAFAQQQGDDLVLVPFSSLSYAAQQEILALRGVQPVVPAAEPLPLPLEETVARDSISPFDTQTVMVDGRRVRINWAIGVYR